MFAGGHQPVYASGECEIDPARRELRILGLGVPIGGRAFEILEVLAQSAGELVTKDELMNRVWLGAVVTENTLHVHAGAVRRALGSYRGLLETESGGGYRLVGDWTVRRRDAVKPPVGLQQLGGTDELSGTNLPAALTPLIGRSTDEQTLQDLVSAYRVVTLTGREESVRLRSHWRSPAGSAASSPTVGACRVGVPIRPRSRAVRGGRCAEAGAGIEFIA